MNQRKWQYRCINFDSFSRIHAYNWQKNAIESQLEVIEKILSGFGKDGWELVQITTSGESCVLKREL